MTKRQMAQKAVAYLDQHPANHAPLLHIEAYLMAAEAEIVRLNAEIQAMKAAHKTQQLNEVAPKALAAIQAVYDKHRLSFYTDI